MSYLQNLQSDLLEILGGQSFMYDDPKIIIKVQIMFPNKAIIIAMCDKIVSNSLTTAAYSQNHELSG